MWFHYQVESVGDAYLVIAGVGEKRDLHAERIANTALGMRIIARDILSPLDNNPIQVEIESYCPMIQHISCLIV